MNNEVPPTLLLFEKLSVMIVQPTHIPHPNVLKRYPADMPLVLISIKAAHKVLGVALQDVIMKRS